MNPWRIAGIILLVALALSISAKTQYLQPAMTWDCRGVEEDIDLYMQRCLNKYGVALDDCMDAARLTFCQSIPSFRRAGACGPWGPATSCETYDLTKEEADFCYSIGGIRYLGTGDER